MCRNSWTERVSFSANGIRSTYRLVRFRSNFIGSICCGFVAQLVLYNSTTVDRLFTAWYRTRRRRCEIENESRVWGVEIVVVLPSVSYRYFQRYPKVLKMQCRIGRGKPRCQKRAGSIQPFRQYWRETHTHTYIDTQRPVDNIRASIASRR